MAPDVINLWCDARMIFPDACADFDGDDPEHSLANGGTVMFRPYYKSGPRARGADDPKGIDCTGVCDASKSVGHCCIPSAGCVEKTDVECGRRGNMFFRYADDVRCEPALRQGLCTGPR